MGGRTYTHTYLEAGDLVLDTPQLVIPSANSGSAGKDGDAYMYLIGIGDAANKMVKKEADEDCPAGDQRCIGGRLRTNKIYYYSSN